MDNRDLQLGTGKLKIRLLQPDWQPTLLYNYNADCPNAYL